MTDNGKLMIEQQLTKSDPEYPASASPRRSARLAALLLAWLAMGPAATHETAPFEDKFRQLEEVLPTPNAYRNAAGQPGHAYWQQKVDYSIDARLDEERQRISGEAAITYHNNSPDTLAYLWLQLDQNRFRRDSIAEMTRTFTDAAAGSEGQDNADARISLGSLGRLPRK